MEQEIVFNTAKTPGNKTQFTLNEIIITTDECAECNGKHTMVTPRTATAYTMCCGKRYVVTNVDAVNTVEDWYVEELLPKFQMLKLLITDMQV